MYLPRFKNISVLDFEQQQKWSSMLTSTWQHSWFAQNQSGGLLIVKSIKNVKRPNSKSNKFSNSQPKKSMAVTLLRRYVIPQLLWKIICIPFDTDEFEWNCIISSLLLLNCKERPYLFRSVLFIQLETANMSSSRLLRSKTIPVIHTMSMRLLYIS